MESIILVFFMAFLKLCNYTKRPFHLNDETHMVGGYLKQQETQPLRPDAGLFV